MQWLRTSGNLWDDILPPHADRAPILQTVTLHVPFCIVKRGGHEEMHLPDGAAGVCQSSCRLDSTLRCALLVAGHGGAAASFLGERVGGPMASAPGFRPVGIEPDRADGLPVARAA